MTVSINGSGSLAGVTDINTSVTLNSNGYINNPNKPWFYSLISYSSTFTAPASVALFTNYTSSSGSTPSTFNLTTGQFTAPVAGVYFFTFTLSMIVNSTSASDFALYKNGSIWGEVATFQSNNSWISISLSSVMNLAANDTVGVGHANGGAITSLGGRLVFTGHMI